MINYKAPRAEIHPSTGGLHDKIAAIQARIALLPWMEVAFGMCKPQAIKYPDAEQRDRRARNEYIIPEVYNKREPYSLMINDHLQAYSFFYQREPISPAEFDPFALTNLFEVPIAAIFWGNLKKIDPSKIYDYSEELQSDAIVAISPFMPIESITADYDKAFDPFTITETFRQYTKPPFFAFRIEGTLSFWKNKNEC